MTMVETTISVHRNTVSVVDFVRETLTQNFPPAAGRRSVGVSESDDDEGGSDRIQIGMWAPLP